MARQGRDFLQDAASPSPAVHDAARPFVRLADIEACLDAVSADGSTLAVGASAPEGTEARQQSAGSAYVFVNQDGHWRQTARIRASNSRNGDAFGERLSLSSDGRVLAVSAVNGSGAARGQG